MGAVVEVCRMIYGGRLPAYQFHFVESGEVSRPYARVVMRTACSRPTKLVGSGWLMKIGHFMTHVVSCACDSAIKYCMYVTTHTYMYMYVCLFDGTVLLPGSGP